jgi:hypothetical protein
MPDFGIMRGFNDKLFGDKLYAGQLPTQLGLIGSFSLITPILDLYPNAAAAYSLRKLRTLYTGNAIRVRRTNLDEADIGFTSLGDLDISALLAFTGTGALDNGFVTTWYDQSGNGRDAIQTTALNQPKIVNGGAMISQNGKPSVYFGWSGNVASVRLATSTFTSIAQPYSVFTAFATDTNDRQCFFDGVSSNNQIFFLTSSYYMISDTVLTYGNATTLMQLHSNFFNTSTNFSAAKNGSLSNLGYFSSSLNGITLGHLRNAFSTQFQFNGNLSECIVYPSNQTSNRTGIENDINLNYAIY